jgi:hypothetical protein
MKIHFLFIFQKANHLTSVKKLFQWLNKMKNIWRDYPVFQDGAGNTDQPVDHFLSRCNLDEATVLEGQLWG